MAFCQVHTKSEKQMHISTPCFGTPCFYWRIKDIKVHDKQASPGHIHIVRHSPNPPAKPQTYPSTGL